MFLEATGISMLKPQTFTELKKLQTVSPGFFASLHCHLKETFFIVLLLEWLSA